MCVFVWRPLLSRAIQSSSFSHGLWKKEQEEEKKGNMSLCRNPSKNILAILSGYIRIPRARYISTRQLRVWPCPVTRNPTLITSAYLTKSRGGCHIDLRSLTQFRSHARSFTHSHAHALSTLLHRAGRLEQVQFFLFRLHHRAPVDVLFDYFRF